MNQKYNELLKKYEKDDKKIQILKNSFEKVSENKSNYDKNIREKRKQKI